LSAERETDYLPVDNGCLGLWERLGGSALALVVKDSRVKRWLGGRTDEGYEPAKNTAGNAVVTYRLLPACELVLRAVDAETGKGIAGELREDWGRPITGQNIGWKKKDNVKAGLTDDEGYFRRLVSANPGYTYYISKSGLAVTKDAEVKIVYGQAQAEHVFKLNKESKDLVRRART